MVIVIVIVALVSNPRMAAAGAASFQIWATEAWVEVFLLKTTVALASQMAFVEGASAAKAVVVGVTSELATFVSFASHRSACSGLRRS